MLAKIKKISTRINPYGGINFVVDAIRDAGIPRLIDSILGKRVKQATFSYSDVILNWAYANLCGAERLEDSASLKQYLIDVPDTRFPSSDSIGLIFKALSTKNHKVVAPKGNQYEFNHNSKLSELLLSSIMKLRLLERKKEYTLDYDNIVIPAEKWDAELSYKLFRGYQPGVAFIGQLPVFVEGRNGNASAVLKMESTLTCCLDQLAGKGINVKRFRSDAAAYKAEVCDLMQEQGIECFIRARQSTVFIGEAIPEGQWERIEFEKQSALVTSVFYTISGSKYSYRVVIAKYMNEDEENGMRCIITNNRTMTEKEVIQFYNQRGAMERNFDMLLNDFNWKRMPFSFMNENTAFLLIGAFISVLYRYIINHFSKLVNFLPAFSRLKRFIFAFVTVASWWKKGTLHLCTNKDYGPLIEEGPPK